MNFEIMSNDHPVRKQALLKYKNIEFTELPNWFFPRFWSKVGIFLSVCFWTRWALKSCLLIIQLENKPHQTKKIQFNTEDILRCSKGLTHDFGEISSQFIFGQNSVEIMSDDHPSWKLALLNYKFYKVTKLYFFNKVNLWLSSKTASFLFV